MRKEQNANAVKKAKKSLMKSQIVAIILLAAIAVGLAVSCGLIAFFTRENIDVYTEVLSYGKDGKNETASYFSRKGEKEGEFELYGENDKPIEPFTYEGRICYETTRGTILTIDKNGAINVIAILDASDGETINTSNTALMLYARTERANIVSLEAVNDNGGYKIYAETIAGTRTFLLEGYESSPINPITLSALLTRCGIFSAQVKLDREEMKKEDEKHKNDAGYTPILNADGSVNLSIYGLEETYETVDENGEKVTKTTPHFILTDTKGNVHKVYIGDLTPDGNHYYVRYESVKTASGTSKERLEQIKKIEKNIYLALKDPTASTGYSADFALILAGKAEICSPKIVYSLTNQNNYNVENFTVQRLEGGEYKDVVCFTYDDIDDRRGTVRQDLIFHFENPEKIGLVGYEPDSNRIPAVLVALTNVSSAATPDITQSNTSANYVKTVALVSEKVNDLSKVTTEMIENDPEVRESVLALSEYGLLEAEYILSYDSPQLVDGKQQTLNQAIFVSKKTATNTYYVWSPMFNQIVEIGAQYFDFISWDTFEWVDRSLFHTWITYCDGLRFTSGGNDYLFDLDQDITVKTKFGLPSGLSAAYITSGSYNADITVNDEGEKSILISLTAKYTANGQTYSHTDDIYNYSLDAIKNYFSGDYTGLTAEEIQMAEEFGKIIDGNSVKTKFDGDENGIFPDLKIELIFEYLKGDLSVSIRPDYDSFTTSTCVYNEWLFNNYYAYYLNDGNTETKLTESELKAVKQYYKLISEIDTVEKGVTVSINGAAPKSIDMEQFKALYAEMIKVSFYDRADRSDIIGGKVLSEQDMADYIAKGDDCTMKIEFFHSIGPDLVYRMHDYSATKSYTTINNSGCFYINIATRKALMKSAATVANGGIIKAE